MPKPHYKKGDTCFFIVSNMEIVPGTVISARQDSCILRYKDNAVISLSNSRLFESYEAAFQHKESIRRAQGLRRHKTPYDFDH